MAASSSFLSRGDSQTASNLLTVAGQGELALTRSAESSSVPFGLIVAQKNFSAALSLAIQASGLDDKEVYLSLGIDAGHWSRIRKGEAHFPMDKIADFCRCVGNRVLPEWLAFQKRRSAGRTSAACSKQRTAAR
jgi:hypothetical protein